MCVLSNTMPSAKKCSKCNKHASRVRAKRCPVCMDTVLAAHEVGGIADNAVGCSNDHQICTGCARRLTVPTELCSPTCGGFMYPCPICRAECCLRPSHVLVLLRGSHEAANELVNKDFDDQDEFDAQRFVCTCGDEDKELVAPMAAARVAEGD